MPLEDDYLFRQFRSLGTLLARMVRGEAVPEAELDAEVRGVAGLDLRTIDRLPPATLRMLLDGDNTEAVERRRVLAELFDHRGDHDKAAALRS